MKLVPNEEIRASTPTAYSGIFYDLWGRYDCLFMCFCGEDFDCQFNKEEHQRICHPYQNHLGFRMISVPKLVFNLDVIKKASKK